MSTIYFNIVSQEELYLKCICDLGIISILHLGHNPI